MKKTETYHDEALRIIMRQQAENAQQMEFPEDLADKLMQRIEQKEALQRKALQRKRRWIAVGIAASLALLVGVALHVFHQDDEKPQQQVAKKVEIKNDSIPEKETEEVTKDSANVIKEIERLQYEEPRLPVAQTTMSKDSMIETTDEPPMTDVMLAENEEDSISHPYFIRNWEVYIQQMEAQMQAHIEAVDREYNEMMTYYKDY
ncbi:MAG: hypothetical protein J6T00_06110 [Bacteroidaceae bacterium]|nr:hypothetical protein [Bacteroidaceae bacterium]